MVQILRSGEEGGFFITTIDLLEDEDQELSKANDIFVWLANKNRTNDRANILVSMIFPAVLSDALHCVYEALECSRKAKLGISYMLIRKPLQENLYILESIILDKLSFAETLAIDSLKLRHKNAGGVEGHRKRISQVLNILGEEKRFDPLYLAKLRYDKSFEDSFDGICNLAMHLFTEHPKIRTDNLNINFIFSGWDQKLTQWAYLYSRLPYLLFYMHLLVEYITERIAPTSKEYLDDISRRISASIILWWECLDEQYQSTQLKVFFQETEKWLNLHCLENGFPTPSTDDLQSMSKIGSFPGEPTFAAEKRNTKYYLHAAYNKEAYITRMAKRASDSAD
ncbi:hypothetical protein [Methylomonas albis]|nr:hypothetical protein [Methylomonas albis]